CDKLTGSFRDNCRFLFMRVSNCRISPPSPDNCIAERTKECPAENGADCVKDKTAACIRDKTTQCERDKIAAWVDEFPDDAKHGGGWACCGRGARGSGSRTCSSARRSCSRATSPIRRTSCAARSP